MNRKQKRANKVIARATKRPPTRKELASEFRKVIRYGGKRD